MGYDADMRKVTEKFNGWGNGAVIGDAEFRAVDSLIQHHYDDRGRLFEDLLNALKRDTDIQSPWDNLCDKGLDLNDRLESAIEAKISNGFRGMNLGEFYDGEKYAWQECKKGRIGLIAEALHDIEVNDGEIFKKLEEDLKKCREDAAVVDQLTRATFGQMSDSIKGLMADIGSNLVALPIVAIPGIGKILGPKAKELAKSFFGGSATMRDLARKKAAAKAILKANDDMVVNAQAQIGDRAIEDIRKRAEELARSWKDATRSDFHADWESFGNACCEILRDKADRAKAKAQRLYNDMRPLYTEALSKSFVSILTDPSSLASFNDKLTDDMKKMFEDLAKESTQVGLLRDSDPKKTAIADMAQIMTDVTESLTELKKAIAENDELIKR